MVAEWKAQDAAAKVTRRGGAALRDRAIQISDSWPGGPAWSTCPRTVKTDVHSETFMWPQWFYLQSRQNHQLGAARVSLSWGAGAAGAALPQCSARQLMTENGPERKHG